MISTSYFSDSRHLILKLLYSIGKSTLALWGIALAAVFLLLAIWYLFTPMQLRIAVVKGSSDERILRALSDVTKPTRSFALRIVQYPDFRSAAEALENGEVNAATVQPDILFPRNGATVAILREEHLIIVSAAHVNEFSQLAGKRLAIVARQKAEFEVIEEVLRHYELKASGTLVTQVSVEQLGDKAALSRVDAIIFVAVPSAPFVRTILDVAANILGSNFNIVALQGVDAFITASPGLTESTLQAGSLRGRPQLPKEEVKTFSVTARLVAAVALDRSTVAWLAEQLFQKRQWIARSAPEANYIQAPEDEKAMSARLPNHRGAIDYFNREQQTFMDQYGDWLWLSLFAAGGASSVIAWLIQAVARRRREAIDDVLERLLRILTQARESPSLDELTKLVLETDQLVARAVKRARRSATSTAAMSALALAIDAARQAIDERRREIAKSN
jgi:TRAP-type uncharacterized transport system substrate-binding protein